MSISSHSRTFPASSRKDARTALRARSATPAASRPSSRAAMAYSLLRSVPNMGGSSLLTVTRTPALTISVIGWLSRFSTARVATFEVGHTSSGILFSARCSSSRGSRTALVPCPMRSARSEVRASQTVSGPVVSPACGTLCSPMASARSKYGLNCGLGTPISGPPRPKEIRPSGVISVAIRVVSSADSSPASPGMSNTQRSTTPSSRSAACRASSIASRNAPSGMPRRTEL
ncbi:hypothetical protein STAL104432_21670 [Streptomyces albus]